MVEHVLESGKMVALVVADIIFQVVTLSLPRRFLMEGEAALVCFFSRHILYLKIDVFVGFLVLAVYIEVGRLPYAVLGFLFSVHIIGSHDDLIILGVGG